MKIEILLTIILFGSCSNYVSRMTIKDCAKCDMTLLVTPEEAMRLDYEAIKNFLCTLSPSCKLNIEFSEVSNESLFKIFELYPEKALRALEENKYISFDYILEQLSTPVNDSINLNKIYATVAETEGHDRIKNKVLQAISAAKGKS